MHSTDFSRSEDFLSATGAGNIHSLVLECLRGLKAKKRREPNRDEILAEISNIKRVITAIRQGIAEETKPLSGNLSKKDLKRMADVPGLKGGFEMPVKTADGSPPRPGDTRGEFVKRGASTLKKELATRVAAISEL